ncbi:MAG: hypothetical protein HC893_01935 [Chloroflexaceae bacterium]|nr:hypothetical protein [Chloroflexaceae bacterium]
MECEALAAPGDIIITEALGRMLHHAELQPLTTGFFKLLAVPVVPHLNVVPFTGMSLYRHPSQFTLLRLMEQITIAQSYVPVAIPTESALNLSYQGEFRPVVTCFFSLALFDEIIALLDTPDLSARMPLDIGYLIAFCYNHIATRVQQYGGTINKLN